MATRWTGPRGWDVELIVLDGHDRLRVRHHGILVADCADVPALERLLAPHGLTLGDLTETPGT